MNKSIPILVYHQLSPQLSPGFEKYTVTPEAFAKQMMWLDIAGYVPIHLDTLIDYRTGKTQLRGRPVVITFDDGFTECINYAVPILQKHRFTATFYLVAGLVGQPSRWLRKEFGFEFDLIGWEDARQLGDVGFQIGSHSVSHPHLTSLSVEACRAELEQSRQLLQDHLGYPVRHLAYPFGFFDERVIALAGQVGYRSACTTELGLSTRRDAPLALHRVPVTSEDTVADFAWRLWAAYPLREWVRGKSEAVYSFRWLKRLWQSK